MKTIERFAVFAGYDRVDQGSLAQVAQFVKKLVDANEARTVLVFSDQTGKQIDLDLRGNSEDLIARYKTDPSGPSEPTPEPRRPGRPKLGVVGREITLLPRHWEWLNVQPGGASVVLRKLVEQARLGSRKHDRLRLSREAAYCFMSAIAGNEPGFEEANRSLFRGNQEGFHEQIRNWPTDVRNFVKMLAADSFKTE